MDKQVWFREALTRFEGRLLRYGMRWVSEAAAREVAQETFLRLWRQDPERVNAHLAEWLFCVCRNLCLDHLKKEARMGAIKASARSGDPSEVLERIPDTRPDAATVLEQRESSTEVARAIGALPEGQQEVLRLKFQEGLSYKEISSITGHSLSYVGVLIHTAVTTLRRELASSRVKNGRAQ